MNWWNKKKVLILVSIAILLVICFVVIVVVVVRPIVGCTMMGCIGGLDITLTGLPASEYQISVTYPSGETQSLTCGPGMAGESVAFEKSCSPNGAFFSLDNDTVPPKKVTVTVNVNGQTFSQEFRPDYHKFQPNGRNCPPTCYYATIEMKITP